MDIIEVICIFFEMLWFNFKRVEICLGWGERVSNFYIFIKFILYEKVLDFKYIYVYKNNRIWNNVIIIVKM